jgi:hypothetical protein
VRQVLRGGDLAARAPEDQEVEGNLTVRSDGDGVAWCGQAMMRYIGAAQCSG